MQTNERIDFLEVTVPADGRKSVELYPENWTTKRVPCAPSSGYKVACRYPDGRIEMTHPGEKRMGYHIILSSKTLDALETPATEILRHFGEIGAKVTRLDCALDVFDYELSFDELWEHCKRREYICNVRTEPLRDHTPTEGDTVYFGRMKATALTRIYDKAKEQKVDRTWVRVETMFRRERASSAALKIVKGTPPRSLIHGHLQLPKLKWYADVMNCDRVATSAPRADGDKRMQWLLRSVAPTLAKEILLHGDDVWNMFRDATWHEVERLRTLTENENDIKMRNNAF